MSGIARAPLSPLATPSTFKARDEFNQTAGALDGKALPDGSGNWAASEGFAVVAGETHAVQRTTSEAAGKGFATPPGGKFTQVALQISFKWSKSIANGYPSLYALSGLRFGTTTFGEMYAKNAITTVGGAYSPSELHFCGESIPFTWLADTVYTLTFLALGGGLAAGWVTTNGAFPIGEPTIVSSRAPTGEQQPYFMDDYTGTEKEPFTRTYDNFSMWVPEIAYVCESGQTFEVNHEDAVKADSTGAHWGPVPLYRGGRFYIPPAGEAGNVTRIAARMRRNDIAGGEADENVTDQQTLEVLVRERFLLPR
jgi:hypothetical protein